MSIMSDGEIRFRAHRDSMIEPFCEKQVAKGVISYGVSSYGYDARVSDKFKIFTNVANSIIDPKNFDERSFVECEGDCIIPPNSFALAHTVEKFKIPRDVLAICLGKSTYARCGIIVNVTPLEPEWEGTVTLELSNTTPLPAQIYANEGICQIVFLMTEKGYPPHPNNSRICKISYADRKGKYQDQTGITLPRMFKERELEVISGVVTAYDRTDVVNYLELLEIESSIWIDRHIMTWQQAALMVNHFLPKTFNVFHDDTLEKTVIKRVS